MVKLLHYTPLKIADLAISKCWDKPTKEGINVDRIERVANKNKHASTIEHLNYNFDITISRACLQELARHRHTSLSVKSSRYTLKELMNEDPFDWDYNETDERATKYLIFTGNKSVDEASIKGLEELRILVANNVSNDHSKYAMPEAYKTSLIWTINARSLQNFLSLRTSTSALWEIRELAYAVYYQIPEDHRFLFKDSICKEIK